MKKLIPLISIALIFMLSGCAAIKKQNNIDEQMKNLVFNASADRVYSAAVNFMQTDIMPTGKYSGSSKWIYSEYIFGGKKNKKKERTIINVTPKGKNQATLRILKESSTTFVNDDWAVPHSMRQLAYEFNTLKRVNPAQAAEIDRIASKK